MHYTTERIEDSSYFDYKPASTSTNEMFQFNDDNFSISWDSPPASVRSPGTDLTFDEIHTMDQPYPSPAESDLYDGDYVTEQAIDFNNNPLAQPIFNSQDYNESHLLSDEISEVLCTSDFNLAHLPIQIDDIKKEYTPDDKMDFLMHERDIMLCNTNSFPMVLNWCNASVDSEEFICSTNSVRPGDVSIARTTSEPVKPNANGMETEMMNNMNGSVPQIVVEHNYNNQQENVMITQNTSSVAAAAASVAVDGAKAMPQTNKLTARRRCKPLQPLKLNLPIDNNQDDQRQTAQIIDDTLAMENEKFDLIKFIDDCQDPSVPIPSPPQPKPSNEMPDIAVISNKKRPARVAFKLEDLEAMIPTPSATPAKRSRHTSTESGSTNCNSPAQVKRRGRPPKTQPTAISPSVLENLNESQRHYMEMRHRNNEASRRSRQNKRGQQNKVFEIASQLEEHHDELLKQMDVVERDVQIWRRALIRLAIL